MMADGGALDPADETCREYERVVDSKYLDQIRTEAKRFSNKLLSRRSGVASCAIICFKKRRNTIKPRTLRKLTKAIHALQTKHEDLMVIPKAADVEHSYDARWRNRERLCTQLKPL